MTNYHPTFSANDYEVVQQEIVHKGFLSLSNYRLRHRLFSGEMSQVFERLLVERQSAVAVLPYDPVLDSVVLIEQFRIGAIAQPTSPWLLEVIAGVYDEGDDPEQVAKREAREEAGCELLDLHPICEYFVSPGGSSEHLKLFCGRVDASHIQGTHGLQDENEDIRAFSMPFHEAMQLLKENKINTSPAIIALQWLHLNKEWLKELWQIK